MSLRPGEPLRYSHLSYSSSMITDNAPSRLPRKRQEEGPSSTFCTGRQREHLPAWWKFGKSDDAPPFTVTTATYATRVFEYPYNTGRAKNTNMVSIFWESLNAKFTTRLSPSVTDITLNFGNMLATCDHTLWYAHTEGLLDSLTRAILYTCTQ